MHRSCVVCVLVADFDVEEIMEGFKMGKKGMTNDIDKIREITGYEPGKAFIYDFNEEGRVRRECVETYGVDTPGEQVVYDMDSKNFHIFPSDLKIADTISESEKKLRLNVYNYFIEYCNNNKDIFDVIKYAPDNSSKLTKSQMSKKENYKNKMIIDEIKGIKTGQGSGNGKWSQVTRGLYKYLPFYYNGKIYNINFMRFYIDKDNKVNCIFKQIQFDRTNIQYVNEYGICYPKTYQNHINKLDKLIQDNKGKNFCYNPPVAYEAKEAEKAIVKEFVKFVKKCEEYDTK